MCHYVSMATFVYIISAKHIEPIVNFDEVKWAHILIIILDLIIASNLGRKLFFFNFP
jgi:hypothetical protein